MNRQDLEKAISDLEYLRAMMTFDPSTGEELNIENDNEDNKSLYRSAEIAIQTLQFELDKLGNKPLELSDIKEMIGKPVYSKYSGCYRVIKSVDDFYKSVFFTDNQDGWWETYENNQYYKYEPTKE